MARTMKNDHTRLGWTAKSERSNAKWNVITQLSSYEAHDQFGQPVVGITADGPESTSIIYLKEQASLELVKGLLMNLLSTRGALTMSVDDEFRNILKQVDKAIALQEEEARQVVACITERHKKED